MMLVLNPSGTIYIKSKLWIKETHFNLVFGLVLCPIIFSFLLLLLSAQVGESSLCLTVLNFKIPNLVMLVGFNGCFKILIGVKRKSIW